MFRGVFWASTLCLILFGCATYNGMTKQQIADNYHSCVLLEAFRGDGPITKEKVRAAFPKCYEARDLYAKVLVLEQGIRERYADFNVSAFMRRDLEARTISELRDAGIIE